MHIDFHVQVFVSRSLLPSIYCFWALRVGAAKGCFAHLCGPYPCHHALCFLQPNWVDNNRLCGSSALFSILASFSLTGVGLGGNGDGSDGPGASPDADDGPTAGSREWGETS